MNWRGAGDDSRQEELPPVGEEILIWTRFAPDEQAIAHTLQEAGMAVSICADDESFYDALPHSLLGIVTVETLDANRLDRLREVFSRQPPWSDVAILLLAGRSTSSEAQNLFAQSGNVTVLERPLRQASLVSVVRSAERARRKQIEVGGLMRRNAGLNVQLRRAMTETHHRVKNNLQLIAALIEMTAADKTSKEAREELARLGSHIRVLSSIHDILTYDTRNDSEGRALSVKVVLEKLLPLLGQAAPARNIQYQVEDVWLPTRHCTSLSMIINELISNALKHTHSDVEVSFVVSEDRGLLSVQDNGPGFPPNFDPITNGRTGLDLVINLSQHDLEGDVRFATAAQGGGYVTLNFPIPATEP